MSSFGFSSPGSGLHGQRVSRREFSLREAGVPPLRSFSAFIPWSLTLPRSKCNRPYANSTQPCANSTFRLPCGKNDGMLQKRQIGRERYEVKQHFHYFQPQAHQPVTGGNSLCSAGEPSVGHPCFRRQDLRNLYHHRRSGSDARQRLSPR